jgi:hypothetical protein
MQEEGPALETLTRRLAECPPDFLGASVRPGSEGVHTAAVVGDLLRGLGGAIRRESLEPFLPDMPALTPNGLTVVQVACWLLYDPWFRQQARFSEPALQFLTQGLMDLARLVSAPQLTSDPDRREELARLSLAALGLRPLGETIAQAQDRLLTFNSAERERVLRETRVAEERARQIREAMARKAAEEAAAKYSRE